MLLIRLSIAAVLAVGCGSATAAVPSFDASADADAGNANAAGDARRMDAADVEPGSLEIFPGQFTEEDMAMRMLAANDPVDLWNAPQGGHVVLLGAKVRNLKSDTANLKVRFRLPSNGIIVAEEGRTVKMVPVPDEPGMMQPDLRSRSQVSNVPLCPSYGHFGIVDQTFDMEVTVTALYTDPVQSGTATLLVVPRCNTPDDEPFCRCECEADYFLGKCRGGAKGGPDASPGDASPTKTSDAASDGEPASDDAAPVAKPPLDGPATSD